MPNRTDQLLDRRLSDDARAELSNDTSPIADRLMASLDARSQHRARRSPAVLAGVLACAALAGAALWLARPDASKPGAPLAEGTRPTIDPMVSEAIDDAADELLDPYRTELQALAAISRDSIRRLTGYLPLMGAAGG